jgi:hypothetical protein
MRLTRSSEYSRTTGRSLSVEITLLDLGLADRSSRCSRLLLDGVLDTPSHPLVNFAPLQSLTHGEPSREATPLMRFGPPLALAEAGSDQHRACLTRLCSASRLSQPLDALLLPRPFRLCFTPVASLGFSLQRFSLPCRRSNLSADLPLLTLFRRLVEAPRFRPSPASERLPSPKNPIGPTSIRCVPAPEAPDRKCRPVRRVRSSVFHRYLAAPAVCVRPRPSQRS